MIFAVSTVFCKLCAKFLHVFCKKPTVYPRSLGPPPLKRIRHQHARVGVVVVLAKLACGVAGEDAAGKFEGDVVLRPAYGGEQVTTRVFDVPERGQFSFQLVL
jgi:hypothetical protein